MNKNKENITSLPDQLARLEAENNALRAENQSLRSAQAEALLKLENQVALEKKYEESQSRFQSIFYQSQLGNKIIAPDLRVLQVNKALQQMLGYTEKEIVGTLITQYAHPDFIQNWQVLQHHLWTRQIPFFQIETCLVRKDGTTLWCQVSSITFRDHGTTLGYTIVEDIDQRKTLETKLKKLYDNQETIMHMVAHDLKSPLFNIQLLSELLKEQVEQFPLTGQETKAECLTYLHMILDTCEKALAITGDLLLIGKLDATPEDFEETDLEAFIQTQLHTLGAEAQKKDIQIHFHSPSQPVYAPVNPERFARVLHNLLSNAVKFSHPGSQVTISLQHTARHVLLQVRDTGVGIPEKLQANLFDKFTRANRIGTGGETTTGLGLYIVKHIVEAHKGRIWLESQENKGTTFFIELPKTIK